MDAKPIKNAQAPFTTCPVTDSFAIWPVTVAAKKASAARRPTWHSEKTVPFLVLNSHTDPRSLLRAQQERTIQFTAPAPRALRASLWQRRMMVKPLQLINYAKAINALSKQLLRFA